MHQLLKLLEGRIMEEVDDAKWYLAAASKWGEVPQVATHFNAIAEDEVKHAKMLCEILEALKKANDISIGDKAVIEFLQEINADQIQAIR